MFIFIMLNWFDNHFLLLRDLSLMLAKLIYVGLVIFI
jgi:hypothetical protein